MVQSGDTLGSMAEKYSTTVDELMTLNPGIDPTALHIGQTHPRQVTLLR